MLPVAVELPGEFADLGSFLADAQAVDAAGAHSLRVSAGPHDPVLLLAALAVVTVRAGLARPDGVGGRALATLGILARGRLLSAEDETGDWPRLGEPVDRSDWRRQLAEAEAAGAAGVVVPMHDRLLDLLRNPAVDDDRSDLQVAQG